MLYEYRSDNRNCLAKMENINDCIECGKCAAACPYGLDTPNLLKFMLKDYNEFYEAHKHLL